MRTNANRTKNAREKDKEELSVVLLNEHKPREIIREFIASQWRLVYEKKASKGLLTGTQCASFGINKVLYRATSIFRDHLRFHPDVLVAHDVTDR